MELITFIEHQIDELVLTLASYEEFEGVEIESGHYQGKFKGYKADNILINMLIPTVNTRTTTCRKQLFATIIAQLKLNFCIKRNPNYELYYNTLEVLQQDSKYIDLLSSDIYIEGGRGLVTINASKLAVVGL